jgi:predicted MFS family arabinose efflux permease
VVVPQADHRSIGLFAVFVGGYTISAYGTYLNLVALSLFTLQVTGSAFGTGSVMALRLLAGFLSGLVAARSASRWNRRTLMVGTDVAQALAMVALVLAPGLGVLCSAAVVLGAGNTLFTVALRSSVPEMVGSGARGRANGYLVTGRSLGTVLGFASAGLIIPIAGFHTAFLINAGSFAVSAVLLALLPLRTNAQQPPDQAASAPLPGRLAVLRGLPVVVLSMMLVRGADALGSASHNVALPIFAATAGAAAFMSQFMTAWAIGSLIAHPVATRLRKRREDLVGERAFAFGTCVMSLAFIAAFTGLPTPLLIAATFTAGLADGLTEISYVSRLQAVPDEQRARVFGLSAGMETAGFAAGTLVASALLEALSPPVVVGIFHGVAGCAAVAFLLIRVIRIRRQGGHGRA